MRFFYALLRPSGLVPEGLFWGKGKEQDRVSCETSCSKTARAHVRRKLPCACSFSEAGAAAAEIVGNCFPRGAKDFALWAWYCRHFDRRRIVERAYYYALAIRSNPVGSVNPPIQAAPAAFMPARSPLLSRALGRSKDLPAEEACRQRPRTASLETPPRTIPPARRNVFLSRSPK